MGDQDEVTAITYATDEIATRLGVLDKLPCVLVMDALSLKNAEVIKLADEMMPNLISILRGAINRLVSHEGFSNVDRCLNELISATVSLDRHQSAGRNFLKRNESLVESFSEVSNGQDAELKVKEIEARILTSERYLYNGSIKGFRREIF